ncbi:hypothetical protein BACCIP111899_04149 [Bacillus rhizoplanae]|uniref:Phage protein n=1 Tax=Bacillus rhizoplanae TaxID=2880966 RepID=A0ABN8A7S4_9BACI|nr:hypothetical protein [Bacillus rhizoplanae]CAG9614916.1 hypothetical protein BACCIP111899_04149 [Bacillus rhizoplanae]
MEQTIKDNYKRLLVAYEYSSKHYQETGDVELLKYALNTLHAFESALVKYYSLDELKKLMLQVQSEGVYIH